MRSVELCLGVDLEGLRVLEHGPVRCPHMLLLFDGREPWMLLSFSRVFWEMKVFTRHLPCPACTLSGSNRMSSLSLVEWACAFLSPLKAHEVILLSSCLCSHTDFGKLAPQITTVLLLKEEKKALRCPLRRFFSHKTVVTAKISGK